MRKLGVRVYFTPSLKVRGWQLINKTKNTFMEAVVGGIKSKYAMILKGEPEKTLVKAGILNSDETFTPDGQDLFMGFLLKKYGGEFKTEVADKIVAEQEKEKKD